MCDVLEEPKKLSINVKTIKSANFVTIYKAFIQQLKGEQFVIFLLVHI